MGEKRGQQPFLSLTLSLSSPFNEEREERGRRGTHEGKNQYDQHTPRNIEQEGFCLASFGSPSF